MRPIDAELLISDLELLMKQQGNSPILRSLINDLQKYPTVDTQKKAQWVQICSGCGYGTFEHGLNFCPTCGAKMEE